MQAQQIINRMDTILERLPYAVKQAHQRIIGERQVANEEKILNLYEEHAAAYVRGKTGAEVESGSQLLLAEAESGLITDWELVCGNPEHDTVLLKRSLERNGSRRVKTVVGDRGLDGKVARELHLFESPSRLAAIPARLLIANRRGFRYLTSTEELWRSVRIAAHRWRASSAPTAAQGPVRRPLEALSRPRPNRLPRRQRRRQERRRLRRAKYCSGCWWAAAG